MPHFREATWEEALDLVAERLKGIHSEHGPQSIAGFGSAKCSNEEAYLFQKLIRAGFGTNNVDHCTRLCHASSVAALFEGVGSGAVSTTYGDIVNADVAHPRRHEHDRQPPGRVVVLQAGAPARHEARGRRRASRADRRPRRHLLPDQAGHGRRLLQRRDARDHPPGARGSGVHRRAHDELLRARQAGQGVPARARGADLRHRRRHDPGGRAAVGRGRRRGRVLGDGHLAAHDRDRQRALPDRAVRDHRPGRPSRHGAAPAARPEQRAGRLRRGADPDDVPRLPAGRRARRARALRGQVGPQARPRHGA